MQVLTQDNQQENSDYTLADDARSVWIEVGNVAIYICKFEHGVQVEILECGREAEDPLADVYAEYP